MPWSNQSGGGGGGWKGGGGPWGQGSGSQPPDLEEMLKRSQDRMKQVMHGGGVPGPLAFLAAVVAAAMGVGLLAVGWGCLRERSETAARRMLLASVIYLPVLFFTLWFDRIGG